MISARTRGSSILKNILVPGTSALGLLNQRSNWASSQVMPEFFEGRRVNVPRNAAGAPADDASVTRADVILVD